MERLLFEGCDLRNCDLSGAALPDCRIVGRDLTGADVRRVRAKGLALHGSRLDDLRGADALRGAVIGPDQIVDLALVLYAALDIRVTEPAAPDA